MSSVLFNDVVLLVILTKFLVRDEQSTQLDKDPITRMMEFDCVPTSYSLSANVYL